jgi:hypothetical protein
VVRKKRGKEKAVTDKREKASTQRKMQGNRRKMED